MSHTHNRGNNNYNNYNYNNYTGYSKGQYDDYNYENENYEDEQIQKQAQLEVDIQLYQRRQVRYNNVFERVFNKLKEYISVINSGKKYPKEHKGILLDLLDYYASIVQLWNREYPEYEPQLKKGYNKSEILKQIDSLIKSKTTDKNDV